MRPQDNVKLMERRVDVSTPTIIITVLPHKMCAAPGTQNTTAIPPRLISGCRKAIVKGAMIEMAPPTVGIKLSRKAKTVNTNQKSNFTITNVMPMNKANKRLMNVLRIRYTFDGNFDYYFDFDTIIPQCHELICCFALYYFQFVSPFSVQSQICTTRLNFINP